MGDGTGAVEGESVSSKLAFVTAILGCACDWDGRGRLNNRGSNVRIL